MITKERISEVLEYDDKNGIFYWKQSISTKTKIGKEAGCKRKDGYIVIRIDGEKYLAHRLAWIIFYGNFPEFQIDHINRNRSDNRISNLRDVSQKINLENTSIKSDNTSGFKGVSLRKNGKWRAYITNNGKFISLGCYDTAEEASKAYIDGKMKYHTVSGDCEEHMQ